MSNTFNSYAPVDEKTDIPVPELIPYVFSDQDYINITESKLLDGKPIVFLATEGRILVAVEGFVIPFRTFAVMLTYALKNGHISCSVDDEHDMILRLNNKLIEPVGDAIYHYFRKLTKNKDNRAEILCNLLVDIDNQYLHAFNEKGITQ